MLAWAVYHIRKIESSNLDAPILALCSFFNRVKLVEFKLSSVLEEIFPAFFRCRRTEETENDVLHRGFGVVELRVKLFHIGHFITQISGDRDRNSIFRCYP